MSAASWVVIAFLVKTILTLLPTALCDERDLIFDEPQRRKGREGEYKKV